MTRAEKLQTIIQLRSLQGWSNSIQLYHRDLNVKQYLHDLLEADDTTLDKELAKVQLIEEWQHQLNN